MRELDSHTLPEYRDMEQSCWPASTAWTFGPAGLGDDALAVIAETFPTHIAGLPVAVNICCPRLPPQHRDAMTEGHTMKHLTLP